MLNKIKKQIKNRMMVVLLLASLLLLTACVSNNNTTGGVVAEELSVEELCAQDGNVFMTMGPVIDGVPTGEPACGGCMVGNNHVCDLDTYLKLSGKWFFNFLKFYIKNDK